MFCHRRAATAVCLIGFLQSVQSIRVSDLLDDGEDLQTDLVDDPETVTTGCTHVEVTDAVRCGVDINTQNIVSESQCGMKSCTINVGRIKRTCNCCPASCSVTTEVAKTCEVLADCVVLIRVFYKGDCDIERVDTMEMDAAIVSWEVVDGPQIAKDHLAASHELLTPHLNMLVGEGVKYGNTMVQSLIDNMVNKTTEQLATTDSILKYLGYVSTDPAQSIRLLVPPLVFATHVDFNIHQPVSYQTVAEQDHSEVGFCNRWLVVEVKNTTTGDREPFIIKMWKNVMVASVYDVKTECNEFYVAQCHSKTMTRFTRCPFKEEEVKVTQMRLWRHFNIKAKKNRAIALRTPDSGDEEEVVWQSNVRIRTIKYGTNEDWPVLDSPENYGVDGVIEPDEQYAAVVVPGVTQALSDNICALGRDRRGVVGAVQKLQVGGCAGVIKTTLNFFKYTYEVPITDDIKLKLRMEVQQGDVIVKFVPPWEKLSLYASETITEQINSLDLPTGDAFKVDRTFLNLDGVNHTLLIKEDSHMDILASLNMEALAAGAIKAGTNEGIGIIQDNLPFVR